MGKLAGDQGSEEAEGHAVAAVWGGLRWLLGFYLVYLLAIPVIFGFRSDALLEAAAKRLDRDCGLVLKELNLPYIHHFRAAPSTSPVTRAFLERYKPGMADSIESDGLAVDHYEYYGESGMMPGQFGCSGHGSGSRPPGFPTELWIRACKDEAGQASVLAGFFALILLAAHGVLRVVSGARDQALDALGRPEEV